MDIKTIASESLPVSGIFLNLFAFSGMDGWIDGELTVLFAGKGCCEAQ